MTARNQTESAIYRVKLTPLPMVIDADNQPVPNSHVVEINFPGDVIETGWVDAYRQHQ